MEKFIIKVNKTVVEEVEVSMPIYRIDSCHAYKIYSQDKCIQVCYSFKGRISVSQVSSGCAYLSDTTKDCTESDFMVAYEKALDILNQTIFSEILI